MKLKNGTTLDPLVDSLLEKRGLRTDLEKKNFLDPQLKDLPDPFLMLDMEKGAKIICKSILQNKSILIWGDYDVDGITATSLLLLFLRSLGVRTHYYIPNRLSEGYGLQSEPLISFTKEAKLNEATLVTVDNGISAHNAVETAKSLGYNVIITDHHTPPEKRVAASAVINPLQADCKFPCKNLAGVGIAFYLAMAVRNMLGKFDFYSKGTMPPNLKQFLDLVALGTVADMVAMDQTNRTLIRGGMEVISQEINQGTSALCHQSGLNCQMIRSEDIGFQVAPRINAAGRLGFADDAVNLFTSKTKAAATEMAARLTVLNEKRKNICIKEFNKAKDEIIASSGSNKYSVIVSGKYHMGVAGIVAANIVGFTLKPALVLCDCGDGLFKGSARSVAGVNIHKVLSECAGLIIKYGGHSMAAGVSLFKKDIEEFKKCFDEAVFRQNSGKMEKDNMVADIEVSIKKLFSPVTLGQLLLMEPHGPGNPQPVFRDTGADIDEICKIGRDKSHLKFNINLGMSKIKGIAFGLAEYADMQKSDGFEAILYSPFPNYFKGKHSWQVRVLGIEAKQETSRCNKY